MTCPQCGRVLTSAGPCPTPGCLTFPPSGSPPDTTYERTLEAAYKEDPGAFATWEPDWRCECGDLNRWHESFCFRCGAGQSEES